MGSSQRDAFAEVGAAIRASHQAARAADLSLGAWKVLSIIHDEIASYSRLEDELGHRRIADLSELDKRSVRRILCRLHEVRAIIYNPGVGGNRSSISLPDPAKGCARVDRADVRANGSRGEQAFGSARVDRADVRANGSRGGARETPPEMHHAEKFSEKFSEKTPPSSPVVVEDKDLSIKPEQQTVVGKVAVDLSRIRHALQAAVADKEFPQAAVDHAMRKLEFSLRAGEDIPHPAGYARFHAERYEAEHQKKPRVGGAPTRVDSQPHDCPLCDHGWIEDADRVVRKCPEWVAA